MPAGTGNGSFDYLCAERLLAHTVTDQLLGIGDAGVVPGFFRFLEGFDGQANFR
jgi:hypothetical protein